jgi:hypothetical protein
MGLESVIFNNEFKFEPLNADGLDLDFSYNQFSPNPNLVTQFVMQLVCSPSVDPIQYTKDWIAKNSILNNIPTALILDNGFSFTGQTKLGSTQSTYIQGQGQNTQFNLLFEPNQDTFFEKSKNLSFPTFSNVDNFVITRYVTESNNKLEEVVMIGFFIQMSIEVYRQAYNLGDLIKEAISTGFDSVSAALKFAVKAGLNLTYLGLVLVAYNQLLKQVSEILFDKPKQLYALDVWKTIEKGCDYLGFDFNSTLQEQYANLTYLPGTTTEGVITGTPKNDANLSISFLDFINRIGQLFNAKLKVFNGSVTFENIEFFENNPSDIQLLDLYNNGTKSFNTEDLAEKISLKYLSVPSDINYIDNEYTEGYSPNFAEKQLFGVENSIDVFLPFALGQRKNSQNTAEKIFNTLFDTIAGLSKSYKISGGNRIGFLKIEKDLVPTDTIFISNGEKIADNSNQLLQCKTLFNEFYSIESPVNNQFELTTDADKQPLCGVNTTKLLSNNVIKDSQGRTIIVTSNIRNSTNDLYEIEYRRRLKPNDFGYFPAELIETQIKSVNNI